MAIEEVRKREFVETDPVVEEPECIRLKSDPGPAFRDYLLPRLEATAASPREEASREVLAALRAGRPLGDAVLDVIESLPEHKTERLRAWVEEAKSGHIYAYVQFYSVFRFSYGLIMTTGGPRDRLIATEEIGENEIDNVRPKWDFSDAIRAARMMGRAGGLGTRAAKVRGYFEEKPMVEVDNENEYDQVLVAMDISLEDGAWEGPGIYNFHDSPSLNGLAIEGWQPILFSDAGSSYTVILERLEVLKEGTSK